MAIINADQIVGDMATINGERIGRYMATINAEQIVRLVKLFARVGNPQRTSDRRLNNYCFKYFLTFQQYITY